MDSDFAIKIKELREGLNLTQADFSEKINVAQAALSTYEKGTRRPTLETLLVISKAFNVSLDWLCGLSNKKSLNDDVTTYAEAFSMLIKLCTTKYVKNSESESDEYVLTLIPKPVESIWGVNFSTQMDDNFKFFFNEWKKMYDLYRAKTIDSELYNLWLKKELSKYDFPLNKIPIVFQ